MTMIEEWGNKSPIKGCDLCGDFPVTLSAKCHPTAPLMVQMEDVETLVLYCYLPECGREVARLKVKL